MKNETTQQVEQSASKGVLEKVDNFVLQMILGMVKEAKLKEDDMITFQLNACPHCKKQRIALLDADEEHNDVDMCVFCEKPTDARVLVYEYEQGKQIICLEEEAEKLIQK